MWTPPAPPDNESERLNELYGYRILDTAREERFDRVTRMASKFYDADVAFLSFVDSSHQWMKSKTSEGLHDFVARDSSVCSLVVSSGQAIVFDDLRVARELDGHPLARDLPWRFYASVPIRAGSDAVIGTLCVMRAEPGVPADFDLDMLKDLAAITGHELSLTLQNAHLHVASNTDALTGLPNRRRFDEELPRAIRRSVRTASPVSLLMIDLDHFKEVNDHLGHAAGDKLLADFAGFLKPFARRPDDIVCRFGGEEFALILAGSNEEGGVAVAMRLIAELADEDIPHPVRGHLSASVGVAAHAQPEDHLAWLARADRALYAAKALGRATLSVG